MKKIGIADFFDKEYDGPKGKIIIAACSGGFFFGLLMYAINEAAAIASKVSTKMELVMLLMYIVICFITIYSRRYTLNKTVEAAEEVICKVRLRLIDKIRYTDMVFIESTQKGEIYARITQDTQLISQSSQQIINTVDSIVSIFAVMIYIAFISKTAFILTLFSILVMYVVSFYNYAKVKDELKTARIKEADFFDLLNSAVAGFKEIKINSKKNKALFADIESVSEKAKKCKLSAETKYDANTVLFITLINMTLAIIVFVVPVFSHSQDENMMKIVTAVLFIVGILAVAFRGIYSIIKANVAVENLYKLEERIDEFGVNTNMALIDIPKYFKEVTLNSLSFRYMGKGGELLFEAGPFNLTINHGETIFIVGGNGSGKSTFLKLLTGLYYPASGGFITMDKEKVSKKNYQAYRELFSAIFSDFHLFKKLYGLESVDKEEIGELLKYMEIHTKTDYKDDRFTNLDLSTGQRKRLAYIAAILEDKPIYVFDEWAADQDPVYRRYFYERFLKDLKAMNKTVIAVTHDDRYFGKADRVFKMEEGRMVQITAK